MRGVFRDEEPGCHEPLPDSDPAQDEERRHGRSRVGRQPSRRRERLAAGTALAQRGGQADGQQRRRERPGFVARQHRGGHGRTGASDGGGFAGSERLDPEPRRQQHQGHQHRLGHRRRLQVQHIRVERDDEGSRQRRDARAGDADDQAGERPDRYGEGDHRHRDAEGAGPVEEVPLDGNHADKVGQRQPDGANLDPARRQTVRDPPGDDQVSLGVVVREGEPGLCVPPGRERAQGERGDAEPQRPHAAPLVGYNRQVGRMGIRVFCGGHREPLVTLSYTTSRQGPPRTNAACPARTRTR